MPSIRRVTRQTRAATAPHTPSHTTSFRDPVHSDLLRKNGKSHASLLSNLHIVPRLPRKLQPVSFSTCTLSHPRQPRKLQPLDWAIQLWVTSCWLYLLTALFNGESPLGDSTSWLRYSMVSYLLVTLPLDCAIQWWVTPWWLYLLTLQLDCAIQWWVTSWLLYNLTELFNGELPLDYSTTWLSYSMVSYLLITLPLDWAIQLFVTTEVSN